MTEVLGWLCLAAGVAVMLGGVWCKNKGDWGPYGDVLQGMTAGPPPDVPREWKWTWNLIGFVLFAVGIGLAVLGAHLLPDVGWLGWLRPGRR